MATSERPHHELQSHAESSSPSLEQTIEGDLLPRLVMAHRGDTDRGAVPSSEGHFEIGASHVQEFVERLRTEHQELPSQLVSSLMSRGASVEAIYCDLLAPAARVLGELWENDECDFLQVTVAMGRLQHTLRDLSEAFNGRRPRTDQPGSILISGLPDEQHTLGLLMTAEFFVRDGWAVNVGHPLMPQTLIEAVRGEWYDVVGLSLALAERASELRGMINRIKKASRNPELVILIGGKALLEDPELPQRVGATAGVTDPRTAPAIARAAIRHATPPSTGAH